jgi:hypothetical protein
VQVACFFQAARLHGVAFSGRRRPKGECFEAAVEGAIGNDSLSRFRAQLLRDSRVSAFVAAGFHKFPYFL